MRTSLLVVLFLTWSSAAAAAPYIATSKTPEEKGDRRTEVNLAMLVGGTDVGDDMRTSVGVQLDIGRRFGDLVVLGEYAHFGLGSETPFGTMDRLGLVGRYSLLRTRGARDGGKVAPVSGDYWFEGGAGVQRIRWEDGGTLTRPELVLGFGWQLDGVIGRESAKPRYFGPFVAFRASVARAPDPDEGSTAICAGPCDSPSGPPPADVSMFFHFGFNWGK